MLFIQLVVLGCACSRRHLLLGHQWSSCEQATQEALRLGNLGGCSILCWLTVCHPKQCSKGLSVVAPLKFRSHSKLYCRQWESQANDDAGWPRAHSVTYFLAVPM